MSVCDAVVNNQPCRTTLLWDEASSHGLVGGMKIFLLCLLGETIPFDLHLVSWKIICPQKVALINQTECTQRERWVVSFYDSSIEPGTGAMMWFSRILCTYISWRWVHVDVTINNASPWDFSRAVFFLGSPVCVVDIGQSGGCPDWQE